MQPIKIFGDLPHGSHPPGPCLGPGGCSWCRKAQAGEVALVEDDVPFVHPTDQPSAPAYGRGRMPTLSGAVVSWDGPVPPLEDFLVQLHRMPRFAGATREPFSVLQHCLHCYWLAKATAPDVAVAALLHDFGEILTGDVPTPMKPEGWREPEKRFVEMVARTWGWSPPSPLDWAETWAAVKTIDHLALHIEGAALTCWPIWKPEAAIEAKQLLDAARFVVDPARVVRSALTMEGLVAP